MCARISVIYIYILYFCVISVFLRARARAQIFYEKGDPIKVKNLTTGEEASTPATILKLLNRLGGARRTRAAAAMAAAAAAERLERQRLERCSAQGGRLCHAWRAVTAGAVRAE